MTKVTEKPTYKKTSEDGHPGNNNGGGSTDKRNAKYGSYDDLRDGKVLMVDQVLLWIVDKSTSP
jgi:hypothetical protein